MMSTPKLEPIFFFVVLFSCGIFFKLACIVITCAGCTLRLNRMPF